MKNILVVDDEQSTQASIKMTLGDEHRVLQAMDGEAALQIMDTEDLHLIILDIRLPGIDGMETLRQIKKTSADLPVVMLTATKTVRTAIEAMKLGASDYITKPFDVDELRVIVQNALRTQELASEVSYLRSQISKTYNLDTIVAESAVMAKVWKTVDRVAKTESTVLITGESGTGKELIARALHLRSNRSHGPFVAIHCPSIPETLLESELFGHERGAYTGAADKKPGLFETANSGTVFLDEISEMALPIQSKLLRVLESGEFEPVGSSKTCRVDARILSATNANLAEEITKGSFRQDLLYRLNTVEINVPPLRERALDIPLLAMHFLGEHAQKYRKTITGFDSASLQILTGYLWPGNVRELDHTVERAVLMAHGDTIRPSDLALQSSADMEPSLEQMTLEEIERLAIRRTLNRCDGDISRAAAALGLSRGALYRRLEKYQIAF